MLKQLAALAIVLVAIAALLSTLSFGDPPPERPRPAPAVTAPPAVAATAIATPSPVADDGAVVITVSEDRVTVVPRSVRRDPRGLLVRADNRAPYMTEVVIARGVSARAAKNPAALDRARKGLIMLGTGEQGAHTFKLPAGDYLVAMRPLTEGHAPPAAAIATARLRVR